MSNQFTPPIVELASGGFQEVGSSGLDAYSGYVSEAYNRELTWPGVAPLYNRIWRSDPELAIVRLIFETWSGQQTISAIVQEEIPGADLGDPTDDDQKAAEFYQSVLEDIEGGIGRWLSSCVTRVPFYGWGWWEVLPGIRDPKWHPPGNDSWRSDYSDGLIGLRRLAFRRYSSFSSWDMDDTSGRWTGMEQLDTPNPPVTIPLDRSAHILFGDMDNPEGLATMETLWRLERYKYNLELIQGMGYEHSAGHSYFQATKKLGADDDLVIAKAARAVATAQEGNYVSLPDHITFKFEDVPFASGQNILQAIRYYSVLKLAVWCMQWVSIASIADTGSYSAIKDASEMGINIYNSMTEGFVAQLDDQVGRRLFDYPANRDAFPGMTRRPRLSISNVRKSITLTELSQFTAAMQAVLALSLDDVNAIRLESGILPPAEEMPEVPEPEEEVPDGESDTNIATSEDEEGSAEEVDAEDLDAEMSFYLANNTGVMLAFYLPPDLAAKYSLYNSDVEGALIPDELHMTLAYLGEVSDQTQEKRKLLALAQVYASRCFPIKGNINGYGRFTDTQVDGKDAVWLNVDSPYLPTMRENLVLTLGMNGFDVSRQHGFTPHITLAYVNKDAPIPGETGFEPSPVEFGYLCVAWGGEVYAFMLLGEESDYSAYSGEKALAFRPFIVSGKEFPVTLDHIAEPTETDVARAVRAFERWADVHDPVLAGILNSKVVEDGNV